MLPGGALIALPMALVLALPQEYRALIVGDYPARYFALDAIPETCMLHMRSLASTNRKRCCLNVSKRSRRKYWTGKGYVCDAGSMSLNSMGINNPAKPSISVCRLPRSRGRRQSSVKGRHAPFDRAQVDMIILAIQLRCRMNTGSVCQIS